MLTQEDRIPKRRTMMLTKLLRLCVAGALAVALIPATTVLPAAAKVPAATVSAKWKSNVTVLPGYLDKVVVPLDGKKRKVNVTCDSIYADACSSAGLRVNNRLVLETPVFEARSKTATHRVVRFPKTNGLVLVSAERFSADEDNNIYKEATSSAVIYRYLKGKLVPLRDLWEDHRALASDFYLSGYTDDGDRLTRSYIHKVTASGNRFTVTWKTVDWSCDNPYPKVVYKYTKGKVTVDSHTTIGVCP